MQFRYPKTDLNSLDTTTGIRTFPRPFASGKGTCHQQFRKQPSRPRPLVMSKLSSSIDRSAEGCVVTVCGGGNAAHTAVGMYSHHGASVNLYLSSEKEYDAWNAAKQDGITVYRQQEKDQYTGTICVVVVCFGMQRVLC